MFHGFEYNRWGSYGWIGPVLNLVLMIGLIIGVILLIVWLARQAASNRQTGNLQVPASPDPKETLKLRYARGEVTREQYLQMLDDLNH